MSDSQSDGQECFRTADTKTRYWFIDQWAKWPSRVDPQSTTNLSFLYGGVLAHRERYGFDPVMSPELLGNIKYLDKGQP